MSDQMPERPAGGGPRKPNRGTLLAVGTLTVAVAVSVGLTATGSRGGATLTGAAKAPANVPATPSSSSSSSSPASSQASAAPSQASLASPPPSHSSAGSAPWSSTDCPSQLASWRSTGAGGQLQAVVTGITIVTQAAALLDADLRSGTVQAATVTALSSAATSLRTSTQAATRNLIPDCVADTRQAEVKGLAELSDAVAGFGNAASGAGSGDYGTAQRDIQAAVTSVQSGSAEMAAAIAGLNQYGDSGK